ncbi:hypothetical protein XENTR_v10012196 [Xenopus tropicalis]|nr:hypothetical protein XENTR_v10012196 [Xenopus tropicalis]KAE8610655.1 hypothetical protein XENTR_v10012196 [Xenopus tropicalis]
MQRQQNNCCCGNPFTTAIEQKLQCSLAPIDTTAWKLQQQAGGRQWCRAHLYESARSSSWMHIAGTQLHL